MISCKRRKHGTNGRNPPQLDGRSAEDPADYWERCSDSGRCMRIVSRRELLEMGGGPGGEGAKNRTGPKGCGFFLWLENVGLLAWDRNSGELDERFSFFCDFCKC